MMRSIFVWALAVVVLPIQMFSCGHGHDEFSTRVVVEVKAENQAQA